MISDFEMAPCEPSPVLPVQMFMGPRWDGHTSGPRALMLAVLEDAIRCIEGGRWRGHHRACRLAAEAEAWVRSGRRQWPFSFVNICEVLGFDVEAMRAHLLARPRNAAQRWHGGGHTIRSGRALGIVTSRRKEQLTHDAS